MRIKTSELTGTDLDRVVAKLLPDDKHKAGIFSFEPSVYWGQGGPIIEREWLDITPWPNESDENNRWQCKQHDSGCEASGPTALVAAMRCFVASKLGDTVEVPE